MNQLDDLRRRLRSEGSITLQVKVLPRSAQSEISDVLPDGILKVKLRAVPENGKANAELREVLSGAFAVPKTSVVIVSGETAQRKIVKITLR